MLRAQWPPSETWEQCVARTKGLANIRKVGLLLSVAAQGLCQTKPLELLILEELRARDGLL